jgi:hypothetical protein
LEIIWFGGFVTKGASPAVPTLFRAAFGVTDKGEIVVPSPLPRSWPGSTEPLVPDEPVLGRIPDPILVMKIDNPNIVTIPVFDAGPAGPPPVGHVDVSAALRKRQQPEVHLPATGSQSSSDNAGRSYLLLGIAAGSCSASQRCSFVERVPELGQRRCGRTCIGIRARSLAVCAHLRSFGG